MTIQKKHTLLADGTKIPFVGFGTYLVPDEKTEQVVGAALDAGYRHIDTAEGYNNEKAIGRALAPRLAHDNVSREDIFITTKLWPGNPDWGQPTKSFDDTIDSLDQSLEKLGVDFVDLYLIHAPVETEARRQQWAALIELQGQGKAKSIGVSNFTREHIEELSSAGLPMPAANQIELHPWSQKPGLVNYLMRNDILPIAYSSLAPLSTWRSAEGEESAKTAEMLSEGEDLNSPFKRMAKKYAVTESQLLLRWAIDNGFPILPKTTSPERMHQNLDLFDFTLDQSDLVEIKGLNRDTSIAWQVGDPSEIMS